MRKLLQLLAIFFFSNFAKAAEVYVLDPNHTNITWSANHYGFSNPSGKFTSATGSIIIDSDRPQNSSVKVVINTSSIQSGIVAFDENLKSQNFLNSAKYPEATFVSKNLILQGRRVKINGDFTLLGVTKEISLDARLNKIGLNNYTQKKTVGFSAITTIKRSDFGMDFGIPGISDEVKISIEIEGILDKNAQAQNQKSVNQNFIDESLFNDQSWKIIPSTSSISFTTNKNNEVINGSFKNISGKVVFNPQDLSKSAISADIDLTSIECSFSNAVSILKTPEWFDFVRYPKANFSAKDFAQLSNNQFSASGNLFLKGRLVPTSAIFYLENYGDSFVTVSGSSEIKRSDFGIGNQNPEKAGGVKDDVTIKFNITAKK